ncbi:hypothetical protein ACFQX6_47655 [Streptosporangium lutulentum]
MGETFLVAFARRTHYDLTYTDARPWLFGILTKLLPAPPHRGRPLPNAPAQSG